MKSRVLAFILVLLGCLAVLPIMNALQQDQGGVSGDAADATPGTLDRWYNLDALLASVSGVLYPLGISIDPDQVVIGRDGWLFLGNAHDEVIARNHAGVTAATVKAAMLRDATLAAWDYWYRAWGVVFLGEALLPNKETVYPDKTPVWATPRQPSPTDALLATPLAGHYFDARPALVGARVARPDELLYLKTDTHWNDWGAWLSYQSLGNWLKQRVPDIDWPASAAVKLLGWEAIPGGDLARFLRLSATLQDEGPTLDDAMLQHGGLNPGKKLLWIRDSFGDAWSPYVESTFAAVSTIHWRDAFDQGAAALLQRLHEFKPDYVLYSVVERSVYAEAFTVPPPLLVTENGAGFKGGATIAYSRTNDLAPLSGPPGSSRFSIDGGDPYWEFQLAAGVTPAQAPVLAFNLVCEPSGNRPLDLQLFWAESHGAGYAQDERSIAFAAKPGLNYVHLASSPLWVLTGEVAKIRLDIETLGACKSVGVTDVRFGAFN